jgi:hypothetical protein
MATHHKLFLPEHFASFFSTIKTVTRKDRKVGFVNMEQKQPGENVPVQSSPVQSSQFHKSVLFLENQSSRWSG